MLTHMKSDGAFSAGGKKKMKTKRGDQGSLKDSRKQKIRTEKIPSIYTGDGSKDRPFTYTSRWVSTRRT
jgi:hypothetical protein